MSRITYYIFSCRRQTVCCVWTVEAAGHTHRGQWYELIDDAVHWAEVPHSEYKYFYAVTKYFPGPATCPACRWRRRRCWGSPSWCPPRWGSAGSSWSHSTSAGALQYPNMEAMFDNHRNGCYKTLGMILAFFYRKCLLVFFTLNGFLSQFRGEGFDTWFNILWNIT